MFLVHCNHAFKVPFDKTAKSQTALTVNMEGGGCRTLSELIFSFYCVFSTVGKGGAPYLKTKHILRTAESDI